MNPVADFIIAVQDEILSPLITLIALAAFLLFIWGVIEFIQNAGDEAKRSDGKKHMIWGLIGLAILFGANAIIALLAATVGA
ncbi:hypothetical protein L0Y34_02100 [Candidatus Parcubacteria bacterium]|nr:hypothetical protein [Candidatus Parcubacteria bacterium]